MKRAVVYPVSKNDIALIRYFERSNLNARIKGCVAPYGSGIVGNDLSYVDNRENMGIMIKDDVVDLFDEFDLLIVTEGNENEPKHKLTYLTMLEAIKQHKDIYCFMGMEEKLVKKLEDIADLNDVEFVYKYKQNKYDIFDYDENFKMGIFEADVPIVLIGGITGTENEFEVLLGLTLALRSKGIKVSAISDNIYASLYNIVELPSSIYKAPVEPKYIINYLNKKLKETYLKEQPEIIFIQAPDAILRYSKYVPNGYGIETYMMVQGICPDYSIIGLQAQTDIEEFPKYIAEDLQVRFGCEVIGAYLNNNIIDYMEMGINNTIEVSYVEKEKIDEKISKMKCETKIPIYNLMNEKGMNELEEYIYERILK